MWGYHINGIWQDVYRLLDETANWASDRVLKFDSEHFWKVFKEHLCRFVLRDRNHAFVFGWSVSNENKPISCMSITNPN